MEVARGLDGLVPPARGSAVTIGAYDGVHLGHRHVIGLLRDRAAPRGLETVVVTFDRHPATVVRPASAPKLLTDLEQKLELLASTGVDRTVVVAFDEARANESAEDFVTEVLVGALEARLVVVGRDFHFGHGRKGNVTLLTEMGATEGFETTGIELADDAGGDPVSSTRIRHLLADGEVRAAAGLLGRCHEVRGQVARGDGRGGSALGMPTANIAVPPEILLPAEGIYAGRCRLPDGRRCKTAVSLGRRPTFYAEGAPALLEAHLIGFEGDLYGAEVRLEFVDRLREERRFESVGELVAQMRADVAQADALLGAEGA